MQAVDLEHAAGALISKDLTVAKVYDVRLDEILYQQILCVLVIPTMVVFPLIVLVRFFDS